MDPLWIVIPTHDRHEALAEQVGRLIRQARGLGRRRATVVVADDCSDPPVRCGGRRPGAIPGDRHVRVVRLPRRSGPNVARDRAITLSPRNAVVVEVDDHDLVEPGALAELCRIFDEGAWLAWGDCLRVNSRGEPAARAPVLAKGEYRPFRLREEGALHVGVRAYRRRLYDEVGGYRAEEFPAGDYALMLRMESRLGGRRIVCVPKVLCRLVTCASGISFRMAEAQARKAAEYRRLIPPDYGRAGEEPGPEPDPPDFSAVEERFCWNGRWGGREVLKARAGHFVETPAPDISAVVPLYRSERFVKSCILSLRESLPAGSEIVVVDDASPDGAGERAARLLGEDARGLLVRLSRNTGFAHATNVGARLARGRHLLLFNADAVAQPGFVEPMLRLMESRGEAAVVGNRHVRPGGLVDSEGSEFDWRAGTYQHVGRDVADPVPGDGVKERDMVTFACALIRAEAWRELGGLDERYRRAYYEDSDFCMRARSHGWRVLYTPDSGIVHVGNHSHAGNGREYRENGRLFRRRWVRTGLVDRFRRERGLSAHGGRVVVCMIACSEEELVAASIESVYPLADRIVVVEGGTAYAVAAGLCDAEGRSLDRTVEEIEGVADPCGKVALLRAPGRPWETKAEQRARYAEELRPGDWMLLMDADEVFSEAGLWRMSALMHGADVVCPGFFLFWNDLGTLGTGRWDDYRQVKAVRWRDGFGYHSDHNCPTDRRGRRVTALRGTRVVETRERLYSHYSWAGKTDEKLHAKCAYYVAQNGAGLFPPDYFERVFLAWRRDPRKVENEFGTHPYGGGGTVRFTGRHPAPVERLLAQGRIVVKAAAERTDR